MNLNPTAVVAVWMDDFSLRGFQLQANGDLVEVSREGVGHAWSPPKVVGSLRRSATADHLLAALDAEPAVPAKDVEQMVRDHHAQLKLQSDANIAAIEAIIKSVEKSATPKDAVWADGAKFGLGRALDVLKGRG